jgi:hypothetical protein
MRTSATRPNFLIVFPRLSLLWCVAFNCQKFTAQSTSFKRSPTRLSAFAALITSSSTVSVSLVATAFKFRLYSCMNEARVDARDSIADQSPFHTTISPTFTSICSAVNRSSSSRANNGCFWRYGFCNRARSSVKPGITSFPVSGWLKPSTTSILPSAR